MHVQVRQTNKQNILQVAFMTFKYYISLSHILRPFHWGGGERGREGGGMDDR